MSLVIDSIDKTLREFLFRNTVSIFSGQASPPALSQITFQPPDNELRSSLVGTTNRVLSIYLVDMRENRRLRSNERLRSSTNGDVYEELPPLRVDCHYLVSAWSPATDLSDGALDEHEILSEVVAVLSDSPALVPRNVFTPGALPSGFPSALADEELPISVVPHEGFPKLAEFWGTMSGPTRPWKPVVYVVVTVPIVHDKTPTGPLVTTVTTEYRPDFSRDGAEFLVMIAGVVRDGATPSMPVADAWVQLQDATGDSLATTRTNERGEFTFGELVPGTYRLDTRAPGQLSPPSQSITVPAPSGRYDLEFT